MESTVLNRMVELVKSRLNLSDLAKEVQQQIIDIHNDADNNSTGHNTITTDIMIETLKGHNLHVCPSSGPNITRSKGSGGDYYAGYCHGEPSQCMGGIVASCGMTGGGDGGYVGYCHGEPSQCSSTVFSAASCGGGSQLSGGGKNKTQKKIKNALFHKKMKSNKVKDIMEKAINRILAEKVDDAISQYNRSISISDQTPVTSGS